VKCSVPKFVWTGGIMALIAAAAVGADSDDPTEGGLLKLHTRRRVAVEASSPADAGRAQRQFRLLEKTIDWQPAQTALIICDMWDQHWCRGAERRVAELAGPMNRVVDAARKRGVFVIHAPSTTVDFY
jgi:hypothetical protein